MPVLEASVLEDDRPVLPRNDIWRSWQPAHIHLVTVTSALSSRCGFILGLVSLLRMCDMQRWRCWRVRGSGMGLVVLFEGVSN